MKLLLEIDVPPTAVPTEALRQLQANVTSGEGITITTANGYNVDVVLDSVKGSTNLARKGSW